MERTTTFIDFFSWQKFGKLKKRTIMLVLFSHLGLATFCSFVPQARDSIYVLDLIAIFTSALFDILTVLYLSNLLMFL